MEIIILLSSATDIIFSPILTGVNWVSKAGANWDRAFGSSKLRPTVGRLCRRSTGYALFMNLCYKQLLGPSLFFGSIVIIRLTKSFASSEIASHISSYMLKSPARVLLMIYYLSLLLNGSRPRSMRYKTTPKLHISTSLWYPFIFNTSGATYARVPHGTVQVSLGPINLLRPKSISLTLGCPCLSWLMMMFSGFISLWTIPTLWR